MNKLSVGQQVNFNGITVTVKGIELIIDLLHYRVEFEKDDCYWEGMIPVMIMDN